MKTVQHSSYWLDDDLFGDDEENDGPEYQRGEDAEKLMRIARLAAIRRAISNFVSIMSGKNIPVQFSQGKESYTDGMQVVISADEDPSRFDPMVGLALHEGSHVLLSDFGFLKFLEQIREIYTLHGSSDRLQKLLPPELSALIPPAPLGPTAFVSLEQYAQHPYWTTSIEMLNDIQFLMNMMEDRRIDKYVYTHAKGYRPYYDALYNKYFFTPEMGKNLRFNPAWREITVQNYLNRLLYMFHPDAKDDALPGLRELIKLVDLPNIDRVGPAYDRMILVNGQSVAAWRNNPVTGAVYDTTPMLFQEACKIYAHILKLVGTAQNGARTPSQPQSPVEKQMAEQPEALEGLPNLDIMPPTDELTPSPVESDTGKNGNKAPKVGKFNEKKAEKELADMKKLMEGKLKKKSVSASDAAAISALEEASADMVDLKGNGIPGGKCMVTRRVSEKMFGQDWFIFYRPYRTQEHLDRVMTAGKRMGQILLHRLQVRNDPLMTKYNRLPAGNIDRRMLAQLGMDMTSIFHKMQVDTHKPVMLHLSLDASGSMAGNKWDKVQTVAVALAYLGSKMRNVETVISVRGGHEIPIVSVLFDSRRDQFNTFVRLFRKIGVAGSTPEGLCFKATMGLITECTNTHDVYFINFSDGEPAFHVSAGNELGRRRRRSSTFTDVYYGGELAHNHTREMVDQMRAAGVKVLSYFISEKKYVGEYTMRVFRKMYGADATFVDIKNAGEVLITLNKLLLKRGT